MILRWILRRAASEIVANPRLQARAATLARNRVKPGVEAAWRRTQPGIDVLKRRLRLRGKPR